MSRSRFRLVKQEAASCDYERKLLVQKISVIKTPVHPKCVFQYRYVYKHLKSPYHGFLKMTVHVVWTVYSFKGMKTSCKDLYLKVPRI